MEPVRQCDVLIAGAGPAGLAAALFSLRARPELACRIVILEKSAHPRVQGLCRGPDPENDARARRTRYRARYPAAQVWSGGVRTPAGDIDFPSGGGVLCTVIRRERIDATLARHARNAGAKSPSARA